MLIISGIAMGGSWIFLYEAYQQIGVSIASLSYYCGPVIVMALTPVLFKGNLTLIKITGFLIVLIGICLINSQALQEGSNLYGIFDAIYIFHPSEVFLCRLLQSAVT